MWIGGVLGVCYIVSAIFFAPVIGAGIYFVALVSGQLVGSAVADDVGLFGSPQRAIDSFRLAGIALVLCAAAGLSSGPDALAARAWAAACGGGSSACDSEGRKAEDEALLVAGGSSASGVALLGVK